MMVGDRAVRLTNIGGSRGDQLLSRVGSDIRGALDAVLAFWGGDWTHEVSVLATGSDEQFRAAAGGGPAAQWADIAAVTVFERVDPTTRSAVGQRIVFAPGAADMSADALRIVVTHELFHYAARASTALNAPQWLTEGVADFVARRPAPLPPGASSSVVSLPSDRDLDTPGAQRSRAYDRAWWFARFVADRYGPAKLRELYVAACGAGHSDLPTAAERVLGLDAAALLAGWRQWIDSAG
ncbi:hypothetical protein [Mycobacterium asiaticum]|uniref:Peptidase n=1 Tax=Mycobacterium asiaticum TaxID=1790 RepID=A0A1A3N9U4_MYCAS|nr:hypothetical protein [Mycobacterium asiaticum]OBK18561.1 hypothetical protein A5636_20410 [Mycobacterium asiaticum]